jgi:hypothetical protein
MPNVYLNGNDINQYIESVPTIVESAGDYGQIFSVEFPALSGINRDGFWDKTNPASPFYGARELSKFSIRIERNGVDVFEGVITKLTTNNQARTASVELKSNIQRNLEKGCIYASAYQSTPSEMASEIASLYNIEVNNNSFARSDSIYNSNSVYCSSFFRGGSTVLDAIQELARFGCARAYISKQKLNFDVFRPRTVASVFTASDKSDNTDGITLWSYPNIENNEKEPIEGYRIEYINGEGPLAATLGSSAQQTFTLNGGKGNAVRINTLQAAVWLGDLWVEYFNTPQEIISFTIPGRVGKSLDINMAIDLEFNNRATLTIDIISIDNNEERFSVVRGLTR